MCAARGNMLASSSKSPTNRKYLGDATDPHFIPSSPIITRQSLSYEEEEELTRVCTLVLSGVPHSDEDEEDEDQLLSYIKSHAPVAQAKNHPQKDVPVPHRSHVAPVSALNTGSQKRRYVNADTATPSIASKRDTIDRTNTSTPLTVLSETVCRSSSSRQNSGLRYDWNSMKSQAVPGVSDKSYSNIRQNEVRVERKPTAALPVSQAGMAKQPSHIPTGKVGHISISHVEYNKSLPALPRVETAPSKERQPSGLSRLFENMRKKSSNPPSAALSHSTDTGVKCVQTLPAVPTVKKNNFKLAFLFDRKKSQQPARMSVT